MTLARSTLLLDSAPTAATVERYITMLLAECEQIAHTEKGDKKSSYVNPSFRPKVNEAKVKKEDGEEKGGKGKGTSGDSKATLCKYFLTGEGCRKGKECGFTHTLDGEKRCWSCGSKSHFANGCPRQAKEEGGKTLKTFQKSSEKEKAGQGSTASPENVVESNDAASTGCASSGEDSMKQILEEANTMLKSMNVESHQRKLEVEDKGNKLDTLQKQLDELKEMNLKVFRLSKLKTAPGRGLLDSGATHPLRPRRKNEDLPAYPKVQVALGGGQEMEMALALVGDYGAEPIILMGLVTTALGCQLTWNPEGLSLVHPTHGHMKIEIVDGCPLMSAEDTLKLIKEIEETKAVKIQSMKIQDQVGWEEAWLRHLTEQHPAFEGVPKEVKEALIAPLEDLKLIANRRRR